MANFVVVKKMTRNRVISGVFIGIVAALVFVYAPAHAATTSGISLSPFQQTISFQPGDSVSTFNVTLTNHTTTLQELDLSVHDFGSLNDTGGIVLNGSASYSQHYGLASWMSLATDTVVLNPGESRAVQVTVTNRQTLQPGGHYGAVVASVNSLNDQSGNKVVINQQLVSLVFVDKMGGEHYDLKLVGLTQNGNWFHLPDTVRLRFQNPGNVHVVPRGTVTLLGPTGTVISKGIINIESAFVLPETYRELYVSLAPINNAAQLPGPYRIVVDYRYDGITKTARKQYAVHYVNASMIVILIVLIAGSVWFVKRRKKSKKSST
jgi:hypothetical protein